MKKLKIYLARPISGCTGQEVIDYYTDYKQYCENMGYDVFSPMVGKTNLRTEISLKAHGIEGNPITTNHAIIERDRWMVSNADVIFANLLKVDRVSIGTCMELAWAHQLGKHTVTVMEKENIHQHAFVLEASDIVFDNEREAMEYLQALAV